MSQRYIINTEYYWFSDYNVDRNKDPKERRKPLLEFELRKRVKGYKKVPTEFYVGIRETKDEIDTLETDWGDKSLNDDTKHYYEQDKEYNLITNGFIDTYDYSHMGKSIVSIEEMDPNIVDASWLFSECFYAEDSAWFPNLNIDNINNMNHMYYHCAQLEELDLSSYKKVNAKDMSHMFDSCISLKSLNLENLDTTLVENVDNMLINCINLYELRLDNCEYETIKKIIESENFPTNKIANQTVLPDKYTTDDFEIPLEAIESFDEYNLIIAEPNIEYEIELYNINITYVFKETRYIYCKSYNRKDLVAPEEWRFINVKESVEPDPEPPINPDPEPEPEPPINPEPEPDPEPPVNPEPEPDPEPPVNPEPEPPVNPDPEPPIEPEPDFSVAITDESYVDQCYIQ